jgi:hypothetical protein
MILDSVDPRIRPSRHPVRRSGERAGQAGDRVGVAGGDGRPPQRGDRVVGKQQESQQPGRERLLGHPALAGREARVGLASLGS